mmetsp:Transcript_36073/g.90811  ORF Transcript_36073/g.90811 Transcript_36073/m.90811 type:complete len:211 (-) Transcript_36073:16-648(-)
MTNDLDELMDLAGEVNYHFQDLVMAWCPVGATHIPGPVKRPIRAMQKAKRLPRRPRVPHGPCALHVCVALSRSGAFQPREHNVKVLGGRLGLRLQVCRVRGSFRGIVLSFSGSSPLALVFGVPPSSLVRFRKRWAGRCCPFLPLNLPVQGRNPFFWFFPLTTTRTAVRPSENDCFLSLFCFAPTSSAEDLRAEPPAPPPIFSRVGIHSER